MSFADLIKKGSLRQLATTTGATVATVQPQAPPSVAIVATVTVATAQKQTANDPAPAPALVSTRTMLIADPDRWCWPHSSAMTGREIDSMVKRIDLFNQRGIFEQDADLLADKLMVRDRETDERRLCIECKNLTGRIGAWRCAQWQRAGLGVAGLPAELVVQLQRCNGFTDQNQK